jgi:hypothetical protein
MSFAQVLVAFDNALAMARSKPTEETEEMIEAETAVMERAKQLGWDYEANKVLMDYCLKATNIERLEINRETFARWCALTYSGLLSRAVSIIGESDDADEHGEWLAEALKAIGEGRVS